jgi:hypothetical protein
VACARVFGPWGLARHFAPGAEQRAASSVRPFRRDVLHLPTTYYAKQDAGNKLRRIRLQHARLRDISAPGLLSLARAGY